MPEREFITGIAGVQILGIFEGSQTILIRGKAERTQPCPCPNCQSLENRVKATRVREFKHAILGQKLVVLRVLVPKLLCKRCGRYFMLRLPGILPKKRATEEFRRSVFHLLILPRKSGHGSDHAA